MRSSALGLSLSVLATLALSGCAAPSEEGPEPETPARLRIDDRSAEAPPTPPPSAPPEGAAAMPSAPQPPGQPPAAPLAPSTPPAPMANAPGSIPPEPPLPASEAPPDSTQWAREYPGGHWVYANGYGWMWVPANAVTQDNEGVPYSYLYTPTYGWTWYVSPWGPGPYRYGGWVRRPWHPVGWHGAWVAGPRVTVRFGGHPHYYERRHRRW
ncbi:MAG: hypothetical protein ABI548_16710 [Polyangiaceae bacterium]